ncbi:hypothetical protein [Streptomyces toxytricini]|uniref:hypothetical protein n=1 Tax=Streptomyces toxytricini TaxID=67369 RepID=UPI0034315B71
MPHRTAAPEPAHRSSRPVHWLATACALAAAVAAAGLLQPATAADPAAGAETRTAPGGAPAPQAAAPDAAAVAYPLDCTGAPVVVTATAQGDLDGDRRPETVAAVRCDAGSGTPPHALYVLTAGKEPGGGPRIVATLLEAAARTSADDLTVRDGTVTARLLGYSSPEVPRSSPDVRRLAKWRWTGGKFRQELTNISTGSV